MIPLHRRCLSSFPFYNSEASIVNVARQLHETLPGINGKHGKLSWWEDGSRDHSWTKIEEAMAQFDRVSWVSPDAKIMGNTMPCYAGFVMQSTI